MGTKKRYVAVQFGTYPKQYWYLSDYDDIKIGEEVLVPVANEYESKVATVRNIIVSDVPPVDNVRNFKKITRKNNVVKKNDTKEKNNDAEIDAAVNKIADNSLNDEDQIVPIPVVSAPKPTGNGSDNKISLIIMVGLIVLIILGCIASAKHESDNSNISNTNNSTSISNYNNSSNFSYTDNDTNENSITVYETPTNSNSNSDTVSLTTSEKPNENYNSDTDIPITNNQNTTVATTETTTYKHIDFLYGVDIAPYRNLNNGELVAITNRINNEAYYHCWVEYNGSQIFDFGYIEPGETVYWDARSSLGVGTFELIIKEYAYSPYDNLSRTLSKEAQDYTLNILE